MEEKPKNLGKKVPKNENYSIKYARMKPKNWETFTHGKWQETRQE